MDVDSEPLNSEENVKDCLMTGVEENVNCTCDCGGSSSKYVVVTADDIINQTFETSDAAYHLYVRYARCVGFGVCKGDTARGKDGTQLNSMWREAFMKAYKAMDKEMRSHPNLDCFCSGSTAVTIVKQKIGNSRAIMGSKDSNDSMVVIQLTIDLNPDLPSQIKRCKGKVFALQDEPEVPRVWLPFDDALGLAIARVFGDFCLKVYGVISIPEFSHRLLTDKDEFIVLASDGHRRDVLSNEEVVEIVSTAPTRASAARVLVDSAAREWKSKSKPHRIFFASSFLVLVLYLFFTSPSELQQLIEGCNVAFLLYSILVIGRLLAAF
ncbi:hypothetical protein AHAS_Ahas13G0337600 [Arachis hypogaea]